MVDAVRLWFTYAGASARAQLQYRVSFAIGVLGQFLSSAIEFVAVWALFNRFGSLEHWSLAEVGVFYGSAHLAIGLADLVSRGFDHTGSLIREGTLDRILLRPRSTELQLLGHDVQYRRLGRLIQGAAVLGWALSQLPVLPAPTGFALLGAAVFGGACLYTGLFIAQATMSIWTVQTLEVWAAATYGGVQASQYPLTIYDRWFRRFFTFLIPLAAASYFPVVAALDKPDPLGVPHTVGAVSWMAGPVFLALAILLWRWGLRHYTSTGS